MKKLFFKKYDYLIYSLLFILSLFTFTTCTNFADSPASVNFQNQLAGTSGSASGSVTKSANFTGTITLDGALPFSIEDLNNNSDNGQKNAVPQMPDTYTYYARATSSSRTIELSNDEIDTSGTKVIFNINLDLNINWTVEAGIKIHNAQGSEVEILKDVFSVKLTANNPILVHEFVLKADSSITEDGTVNLNISVPENVTQIKTECSNTSWPDSLKTISVTSGSATLSSSSVPAGNYELTIKFYTSNGTLVYSTIQNICVLANFETKNWIDNGSGLVSSNSLTLTSTHVNQFSNTQIYVASTSASSITDPGNDSTGLGTKYFPYATLSAAIKKIDSIGSSSTDYTIWVNGNVSGTTVIDSNLIASNKAHSITIEGCSGNSTDKLNGAGSSSSVIKVDSTIPFIIKNLTVTGGNASKGGGIYITKTGASVTLAAGAKVSGNTATYGKGVYVEDGDFILTDTGDVDSGNDVYLKENKVIKIVDSVSETDTVKITPEKYKRGMHLVESATTTISTEQKNRFILSEYDEDWTKNLINSNKTLMITSPVYVAGTAESDSTRPSGFGKGLSLSDGAVGTKHKPFSTIADALTVFDDSSSPAEIEIVGTVTGAQIVGGSGVTINASALTIKGYIASGATTSDAVLNGGGTATSPKTTLTVNTSAATFPVTIQNIKITGGNNTNGGGINIASGATVMLGAGVKINKNTAKLGGGIYNAGTLFMYGNAIVGYNASSAPADSSTASNNGGNTASGSGCRAGGIYNSSGTIYLGYTTTTNKDNTFSGGIIGNYSADQGGGVFMSGGSLYINRGSVSCNKTETTGGGIRISDSASVQMLGGSVSGNVASSNAGGFYVGGSESLVVSGGSIEGNEAGVSGGAVYLNSGTLTMTGGTMGGSTSAYQNTAGTSGGAIYQNGTFEVSGSAYVYTGSEKTNDVYLASEKVVTINSNYNGSGNTASNKMALTPANWKRGSYVLGGVSCNITNAGYFKITDNEWSVLTDSTHKGKIDADIWVAGTGTLTSCSKSGNDSTGNGTKAKPYASITQAVSQCWGGPKDTATGGRTINVEGTVTAATNTEQTISSSITSAKAIAIKLSGNGSGVKLQAASGKRVLSITTSVPVTITNMTISGGNTTGSGAGIYVSAAKASLTLTTSAVVTGNSTTAASGQGGGIYIAGTSGTGNSANLIMNSSSSISGNSATGTSGFGGGVYLYYANLCMSGNALIGDTSGTSAATNGSKSNSAVNGGGVYCDVGSKIYLGYANASDSGTNLSASYGIRHNYASASGGGVYLYSGSMTIKTGAVSCNGTNASSSGCNGGGICIASVSGNTFTMTGGTIARNKGNAGGGIYASGAFTMSGGIIGGTSGNENMSVSDAGGAIYANNNITFAGSASVPYNGTAKYNDICLASGKKIAVTGNDVPTATNVATIVPSSYATTTSVMGSDSASAASNKFKVRAPSDGTVWYIETTGYLNKGAAVAPANAAASVASLTEGGTLKLTGNPTAQQILDIRDALYNTYKDYGDNMPSIIIDLSDTTITSIPENAFWPAIDSGSQCKAITSVKLPTTVTSIGKNAFAYCTNMTSISGYSQVTSLGDGAFRFCSSLTSFTIPSGLTSKKVPDSLLYGCGNITSITIPSGFTEIGDSAFFNAGLTSVTIPSSVTTIDRLAFNYCKFTTFTVPSSVTTLGEYFMSNNKSLTSVTIPNNSISKIPDYAFEGCSALTTVNYYNNITEIGKQAFEECTSLTSFTVKTNVRKVGYCFLWKSGNINTITFEVTSGWKYKNGNTETSVDSIIANQTDLKNALIGVLGQYGYSLGNSQDWYR